MIVMYTFVLTLFFFVLCFPSSLSLEDSQENSKELHTNLVVQGNQHGLDKCTGFIPYDCVGSLGYQPHEFAGFQCPKGHGKCRREKKNLDTPCAVVRTGSWLNSKILHECRWFKLFRDRPIVLVGDSMMRQLYNALIHIFRGASEESIIYDYNIWGCGYYGVSNSDNRSLHDVFELVEYKATKDAILCVDAPQDFFFKKYEIKVIYVPAPTYRDQRNSLQYIAKLKLEQEKTVILFSHQMWEVLEVNTYEKRKISLEPKQLCQSIQDFFLRTNFQSDNFFYISTPYQHIPTKLAMKIVVQRDKVMQRLSKKIGIKFVNHNQIAKNKTVAPLKNNNWHHQCSLHFSKKGVTRLFVFGREKDAECTDPINIAILRAVIALLE